MHTEADSTEKIKKQNILGNLSQKCFKKMGCLEKKYEDAPQHWAGLQIYEYSEGLFKYFQGE